MDFVVGPAVICSVCHAEVHSHCMQVLASSPVCFACLGERDLFMSRQQTNWQGQIAAQVGRQVANGGQIAGQFFGMAASPQQERGKPGLVQE